MSNSYTGTKEMTVSSELIDKLYTEKKIENPDKRFVLYPNMFVVLSNGGSQSAITRVKDGELHLVNPKISAKGICPKNKEQVMALDLLLDPEVKVVILTGKTGSGKTLLTLAAALSQTDDYQGLILTRPMSESSRRELGILPGDIEDKFGPFLSNYTNNIEQITGARGLEELLSKYPVEIIPLSLIRGASWCSSFIIADEAQTLDFHRVLTLGTRVGEGSKIVIMGDLRQRDDPITIEKTGLHKFVNDSKARESPLVGVVELVACVRSEVAKLFSEVFDE